MNLPHSTLTIDEPISEDYISKLRQKIFIVIITQHYISIYKVAVALELGCNNLYIGQFRLQ